MSETLVTALCIVGVFLGALILAYRYGKKHKKVMDDLVAVQGWVLSRNRADAQGVAEKLDALLPDLKCSLTYVMTVETGSRTLVLADGDYVWRSGTKRPQFASFCLLESPALKAVGAHVEMCTRTWFDKALLGDQVDMGVSPFAEEFIVQSKDSEAVWKLIDPAMQAAFMDHMAKPLYNPMQITVDSNGIVLLTGAIDQPERWLDLVEFARQIEDCIARQRG